MSDEIGRLVYQFTPEQFHRQMARAWRQGYAAGWKDQECDFPPNTTDNPWGEQE